MKCSHQINTSTKMSKLKFTVIFSIVFVGIVLFQFAANGLLF